MSLGYEWRPDGQYLIRLTCHDCERKYDIHACSNAAQMSIFLCPHCAAARQMNADGTLQRMEAQLG